MNNPFTFCIHSDCHNVFTFTSGEVYLYIIIGIYFVNIIYHSSSTCSPSDVPYGWQVFNFKEPYLLEWTPQVQLFSGP